MAKKKEKEEISPEEILEESINLNDEDGLTPDEIVEGETKEQLFKRIGERRVRNTLHQIKLLGNLSNKHVYSYTPEQVQKILKIISTAVERLKFQFDKKIAATMEDFSL